MTYKQAVAIAEHTPCWATYAGLLTKLAFQSFVLPWRKQTAPSLAIRENHPWTRSSQSSRRAQPEKSGASTGQMQMHQSLQKRQKSLLLLARKSTQTPHRITRYTRDLDRTPTAPELTPVILGF
jgi:hypothetical protein